MKRLKKYLATFLMAGVLASSFSGIAFAAEAETASLTETHTYETDNNADAASSETADNTSVEDEKAASDTTANTDTNVTDGAVASEDNTTVDPELLDGYEIYVDEQGEVYYLEKEPEEPVTKESIEEDAEQAEEEEKKEEKQEEKKDKKEEKPVSEKDLRLLTCLIYSEARGQSYEGMLAVANVVLNRVKSDVYSHVDTVKEVIYDKKWSVQFAVTIKSSKTGLSIMDKALKSYDTGKFTGPNPAAQKKAMEKAKKAAKAALQGKNNIGKYLCFNAVGKYTYRIKEKYPDYKIIGDHIFYRTK